MSDGRAVLDAQIAKIRELQKLVPNTAPRIATAVDGILRQNIASGKGPDGKTFKLTKEGKQPLQNAGKALTVKAVGNVILCKLAGPEALHHLGRAKGHIVRQILPTEKIPAPMVDAMQQVAREEWNKIMGGKR